MKDLTKYLIGAAVGIVIGLVVYEKFLKEETEVQIVHEEKTVTDTVFVKEYVTVEIPKDRVKYVYLRDTVIEGANLPIRNYSGSEPTLYGNIGFRSEVAGEMLNINLFHDISIPSITNTITKTTTKTIIRKPSGIYATAGINSNFNYSLGLTYLNDKSLVGYEYQPQIETHSLKVGIKLFK